MYEPVANRRHSTDYLANSNRRPIRSPPPPRRPNSHVFPSRELIFQNGSIRSSEYSTNSNSIASSHSSTLVNLQAENQINGSFWWRTYRGKFGSFRYGMQYSYTHLDSFAGAGGMHAPTDDSMDFTSIRYYPF